MADPRPVDGLTPAPAPTPVEDLDDDASPPPPPAPESALSASAKRLKSRLLALLGVFYVFYIAWSVILLMVLPDPSGGLRGLVLAGVLGSVFGLIALAVVGLLAFLRVNQPDLPIEIKRGALLRIGIGVIPGLILSVVVPFMITREPILVMDITEPLKAEDFVAPVAVTFSVEEASAVLQRLGMRAIQYRWDFNGDGKVDRETVTPTVTANFDKEGVYSIQARLVLSDGDSRIAGRRMIISKAVFTANPTPTIVERPVVFSIANLVPDRTQIKEVTWDFDGDGTVDQTVKDLTATHIYYAIGKYEVTMKVDLNNKTSATYTRTIDVQYPPPLPFPIKLITEPKRLISNPPFGVQFSLETDEPLVDVEWFLGEGEPIHAETVTRTYDQKGRFTVVVKARSASGSIAELSTVVRVVDELQLSDLTFDGSPTVTNGKIVGEAPVTLQLTPKTGLPFVQFYWEAPDATEVGSTDRTLQAIYRKEGTYVVTLIAEDREDHVKRIPITVEVKPPSSSLVIRMDPEGGVAPLRVRFDASESYVPDDTISGFVWSYGDRSEEVFGAAQVEHVYTQPGTYNIDLTVKTNGKKEYRTSRAIVVRAPPLRACIEPSRISGSAPLGVRFDSTCSVGEIQKILWDFDDGGQSDQPQIDHVFERPGTYDVELTVTDKTGRNNSEIVTITVTDSNP